MTWRDIEMEAQMPVADWAEQPPAERGGGTDGLAIANRRAIGRLRRPRRSHAATQTVLDHRDGQPVSDRLRGGQKLTIRKAARGAQPIKKNSRNYLAIGFLHADDGRRGRRECSLC